jgi:nucleoid DNA-binding protein
LKPKKSKDLIEEVAKQTGLSEHLVKEITGFYWQEVRKSLSSLKHARIHVTNLGDFTIKHWKIADKINLLENFEENNRQKGLQQMTARFKTAETLFDLKAVQKLLEEENQRKDFIKLHKTKSDESKREHNTNLESKGTDPGGNN